MTHLIQINYKSGQSMQMLCTEFKVNWSSESLSVSYTLDESSPTKPMYINLDEVESVWQVYPAPKAPRKSRGGS